MKRVLGFLAAAALGFSCFAAPAKIATQDWVKNALAAAGVRVSTAVVQTNIATSVTGAVVTNLTFSSAYTCPEVPQCRAIYFTVSTAKTSYRQAMTPKTRSLLNLLFASVYADGEIGTPIDMLINSGYWVDEGGKKHNFVFDGGWLVELNDYKLPPMPSGTHACALGSDCVCEVAKKSQADKMKDAEYQRYKDTTGSEFWADYGAMENWLDLSSWGSASWQHVQHLPNGKTVYYIYDDQGLKFNLENLWWKSDALAEAMATTVVEYNKYMKKCREEYLRINACDKKSPQHLWVAYSCGSATWKICGNNASHKEGSEKHTYPGAAYNETSHACVCGKGEPEPHGVLVIGERTATAKGWTEEHVCPKRCGYVEIVTHTHTFVNCGPCESEDCDELCACGGNHQFGKATAHACAKCECEASEGCNAKPPADDMSLHAGWLPCGEDTEGDNDWLEAKGAHCQCQCKTFGHIARTDHDYVLGDGLSQYEEIAGDNEKHYRRLGQCTRCNQYKKQYEKHNYPEEPNDYDWVSDDNCRKEFICKSDGCGHRKYENGSHKLESAPSVYENISAEVCRRKTKCTNCNGYKKDDSHGHERDVANGCRCKNGCGYTFSHEWIADACGNERCKHCKSGKNGVVDTHSGWHDAGSGIHKCACGVESQGHGPWTDWAESSRAGGVIVYKRTCTVCGCEDVKLVENGTMTCDDKLDFHVAHSDTCGCQCGKYGSGGEASTDKNLHKWSGQKDANGILHCMCKCGRFHEQRAASTYMVNLDKVCGSICAYCREKAGTGLDIGKAADTLHTPNEPKDGTCGCKCGALDHTSNHEMFHIQKPGSCCCLGSDGNGGSWHFRMDESEACSKICSDRTSFGGPHLRAGREKEDNTPRKAQVSDHDKYDGYSCGCECREYNHSNYAKWTSVGNFHNGNPNRCGCYCGHASESQIVPYHKKANETDCECECKEHTVISHVWADGSCYCNCRYHEKKHQKKNNGLCTAVCHGGCGEASDAEKKGRHTPAKDRCGCECGRFQGSAYEGSLYGKFHIEPPYGGCVCPCGEKHFFEPDPDCPNVCQWCEMDVTKQKWGEDIHSFGNRCVCACGKFARGHVLGEAVEVRREEGSCDICYSEDIEVVVYERKCQRECDYKTEYYEEEGHIDDLHDEEDLQRYCENHNIWYGGSNCPMCEDDGDGDGGNNDGNNNNGGGEETGGSGNPGDIIFNPPIPAFPGGWHPL